MAFGVYVHIPYCLQRCVYCDFATFELNDSRVGPQEEYISLVYQELIARHKSILSRNPTLDTLYFGGGTPSLLEPESILAVRDCIRQCGFTFSTQMEWTIEINPATINARKLDAYLEMGINRFSLGVQSFADEQLQRAGRKHSAQQTRETLKLLKPYNFSMDLLFALPNQSLNSLKNDLEEFLFWNPKHISPYCLTVPHSNPMAKNRPEDDTQIEMFELIRNSLIPRGYLQYEISNYAQPGFESRHNQLYWEDQDYWGIGLSSHSYIKSGEYGVRFWNPSQYGIYKSQVEGLSNKSLDKEFPYDRMPANQFEKLKFREALTDYCHTALRTSKGLILPNIEKKFSPRARAWMTSRLEALPKSWLYLDNQRLVLSPQGQVLSNRVFEAIFMDEAEYGKLQRYSTPERG